MLNQLQAIMSQKQILSSKLSKLRNKIFVSIYDGAVNNKPTRVIHQDILKIIKGSGLPIKYTQNVLNFGLKLTKKAKKIDVDIPILCFNLMQDNYKNFKSVTNKVVIDYEADNKKELIDRQLKHNRKLENPKIFYLCSHHKDCAKDHLHYQGKIYVDEKWESYIKDKELKKQIQKYIALHNIETFQWVTSQPVWMITRPNCRHYFKALTVSEVLGNSVKTLIQNNKMTHTIGKRVTQTIAHSTKDEWYTRTNIEAIIKQYKDRLEFHQELYKVRKVDIIKRAIEKDKFLIQKWQKFLTSQQN